MRKFLKKIPIIVMYILIFIGYFYVLFFNISDLSLALLLGIGIPTLLCALLMRIRYLENMEKENDRAK